MTNKLLWGVLSMVVVSIGGLVMSCAGLSSAPTPQIPQQNSDNLLNNVGKSLFPTDEEIQTDAFKLINGARVKAGLAPLIEDPVLTNLAREHSLDMKKTGVISHNGFDSRMARSGYSHVGENCAEGYQSAESLVNGWLNSSGHRANIMNPEFHFTGLVYISGWATQMFAGY